MEVGNDIAFIAPGDFADEMGVERRLQEARQLAMTRGESFF